MITDHILLLIRVASSGLALILSVRQGYNLYKRRRNLNGMKDTRISLFLLTLSIFLESAYVGYADFLAVGGSRRGEFFNDTLYLLVFVRLVMLYSIYKFYRLFWGG